MGRKFSSLICYLWFQQGRVQDVLTMFLFLLYWFMSEVGMVGAYMPWWTCRGPSELSLETVWSQSSHPDQQACLQVSLPSESCHWPVCAASNFFPLHVGLSYPLSKVSQPGKSGIQARYLFRWGEQYCPCLYSLNLKPSIQLVAKNVPRHHQILSN